MKSDILCPDFLCPDFLCPDFLCPDFCAPIFALWYMIFPLLWLLWLHWFWFHHTKKLKKPKTNKQTKKTRISLYLKGLFVVIMKSGSLPLNTTCAVPVSHCHFKFLFSIRKVPWHFPVLITKRNSHQPVIKSMKFCDFNLLLRESFYSQDMKGTSISWTQCHFILFFFGLSTEYKQYLLENTFSFSLPVSLSHKINHQFLVSPFHIPLALLTTKISLVILLTVCHTILVMLVENMVLDQLIIP